MAYQPCWVRPGPGPDLSGVDQPSLLLLTLLLCPPGDLGGQMGLFIGASILTLLEILDYIYEARDGRSGGGHPERAYRVGAVGKQREGQASWWSWPG